LPWAGDKGFGAGTMGLVDPRLVVVVVTDPHRPPSKTTEKKTTTDTGDNFIGAFSES